MFRRKARGQKWQRLVIDIKCINMPFVKIGVYIHVYVNPINRSLEYRVQLFITVHLYMYLHFKTWSFYHYFKIETRIERA